MPQPVSIFLRQSLMLKAAIAVCLEEPQPKPVHRLRSVTRRIEATLALLGMSTKISGFRNDLRALQRSLRKARRAAGNVRDFDVHRELLDGYKDKQRNDAVHLDNELAAARKKAARELQRRLEKDEHKIHRALDDLAITLTSVRNLNLKGEDLAAIARGWFKKAVRNLDLQHDDELHSIRKACKTARYLAEIGGKISKPAADVANRFEMAQQTLGSWHDHHLLLAEARASLRKDNQLVAKMQVDTERLRLRADSTAMRMVTTT